MKTTRMLILGLAASFAAHADFSYTQTMKSSQGAPQTTKVFLKGSKMMTDRGDTATLVDLGAQTVTTINKTAKTYSVQKMGEMMAGVGSAAAPQMDVKETGQKKTINGFNCSQRVMTISTDGPTPGVKMQMELEMWVSPDVPGWQKLREFYQKNAGGLNAMGGGSPGMQRAMIEAQKRMATMDGAPVQQVMRMKAPGMEGSAAQMQGTLAPARARLEEMIKQGGPQAEAAKSALARMPGGAVGGSGTSLFETTIDSSGFSAADVPDSVFAIPGGFTQK
jgi:hypothetical protein